MTCAGDGKEKTARRRLSRDELELWHEVTRSITRLRRAPPHPALRPAELIAALPQSVQRRPETVRPPLSHTAPAKVHRPALAPLDRRLRKQLARGRSPVDDVLDLHGLRQDEAHLALRSFLAAAQSRDAKVVLIVTGKGLGSGASALWPEQTGGVLYRAVPHWLSSPEFRQLVTGFHEADSAHGGAGALYVRVRRANRPATPKSLHHR